MTLLEETADWDENDLKLKGESHEGSKKSTSSKSAYKETNMRWVMLALTCMFTMGVNYC